MNKIDDAWAVLKKLPPQDQELAAEAILDYAAQAHDIQLSDAQAEEIRRRLQDVEEKTVSPAQARARLLGS